MKLIFQRTSEFTMIEYRVFANQTEIVFKYRRFGTSFFQKFLHAFGFGFKRVLYIRGVVMTIKEIENKIYSLDNLLSK